MDMGFNFLDEVKGHFTPDLVTKAANTLGETEAGIKTGLDAIVPITLTGITIRAQHSPESIFRFSRDAMNIKNIGNALRPGGGGVPFSSSTFVGTILGNNLTGLMQMVASFTGLKNSSVAALFSSAIPLALCVLGKHVSEKHLRPDAMSSFLDSQRSRIISTIPSGLNVNRLLPARKIVQMGPGLPPKTERNWRTPLLIILGVLILLWWLFKKAPTDSPKTDPKVESPRKSTAL
jgi:hypothetical protein